MTNANTAKRARDQTLQFVCSIALWRYVVRLFFVRCRRWRAMKRQIGQQNIFANVTHAFCNNLNSLHCSLLFSSVQLYSTGWIVLTGYIWMCWSVCVCCTVLCFVISVYFKSLVMRFDRTTDYRTQLNWTGLDRTECVLTFNGQTLTASARIQIVWLAHKCTE